MSRAGAGKEQARSKAGIGQKQGEDMAGAEQSRLRLKVGRSLYRAGQEYVRGRVEAGDGKGQSRSRRLARRKLSTCQIST